MPNDTKYYLENVSKCICEYISKKQITIKAFANLCDMSYTEMRELINRHKNDIRLSTLIMIADCMNVPVEYLIAPDRPMATEEILLHDIYIKLKTYNDYHLRM